MPDNGSLRRLPSLVHVRKPSARASVPPPSSTGKGVPSPDDVSARTMQVDALRRELQSGGLPRETEVLFPGLGDWTAAHEIPELWVAARPPEPEPNDDPAAAAHDPTRPSIPVSSTSTAPRRKGFGALSVIAAIVGAIALLGVGAAAIYFVYFHYKPVAVQHLPRRCVVAARFDLLDLAWFDPLAKKLVPAIEEATAPPPPPVPPPPPGPTLKERLKAQANIDVDRGDVREIAMCAFSDTTLPAGVKDPLAGYRAVVAIGGRFKTGIIPGLFEALRPELGPTAPRLDGTGEAAVIRILPSPATGGIGLVIGQAEDGTILVAPNDATLASAREQRSEEDARATTGLLQKGSVEIVVEHVALGLLFGMRLSPPPGLEPTFKALAEVQQAHLGIDLSKKPRIELTLEQKNEPAAKDAEAALRKLLDLANKELATTTKDWAGEHAALGGARIVREDTRVDVKIDFHYADVDRGATDFSNQLKDPASPFRTKTWPVLAFRLGVGPMPPSLAPAASGSASGSPGGSPSGPPGGAPSTPPPFDEDDD